MTRKRGQNEGSVYQRKDGRWAGAVSLGNGRRKTVYGGTAEETRRKLAAVVRQIEDGEFVQSETVTVRELSNRFLASVEQSVKRTTLRRYRQLLETHLIPHIGHRKIKSLQASDLESVYQQVIKNGRSQQTAVHVHRVAHTMLEKASRWQIVTRNVASLASPPRVAYREMRTLSPQEVDRFLRAATGTRLEALWRLAIGTGMRLGEILALKWSRVDLSSGRARIEYSLTHDPELGTIETETKTRGSRRTVSLSGSVVDALINHKITQEHEAQFLGDSWQQTGFVFTSRVGTPLSSQNIARRDFKRLLADATIHGHVRIQDLRHTAISLSLSAGVAPTDVAEMAGHSSVAVTLQRYAHALPGAAKRASDAIEEIISGFDSNPDSSRNNTDKYVSVFSTSELN